MGERAASASAFQPYSCDASTAAATPVLQHEGEDESSHNEPVSPYCQCTSSALSSASAVKVFVGKALVCSIKSIRCTHNSLGRSDRWYMAVQ